MVSVKNIIKDFENNGEMSRFKLNSTLISNDNRFYLLKNNLYL